MKKQLLSAIAVTVTLLSCGDMLDKTGVTPEPPTPPADTTIDAVSSASQKFKLNGGTIYGDSVNISFWYKYDNGFTWAKVIDDEGNVIINDTLNIPPLNYYANEENSHTLQPLKPGTSYHLIMDGIWEGKDWPLDTVHFTTRTVKSSSIDAVSSASQKFKLNGGTVYSNSVDISFWYKYDNGFTWAKVIDDQGKVIINDTLNIPPLNYYADEVNTHTLQPLEPSTSYHLIMDGIWEGEDWPLDTVHFTTEASESVLIDAVSSASQKFKLTGGEVFTDSVQIDFWYRYDNGFTWAKVVDYDGNEVVSDTLNIPPLNYYSYDDNSHILKPLQPGTDYKLVMDGIWEGEDWPLDTVYFTTLK